jgi:chitodextrinase
VSAARIHRVGVPFALLAVAVLLAGAAAEAGARNPRRDQRAPTKPTNLRVSSATASAVSLAWDPSWDKVGVRGYRVHLNRSVVATSTLPWATISGLGCGRAYTFGLDAYDAAGNYSRKAWATVATAACPDQQAPTAPSGFRQQAATQDEVVLAWDPSTDNIGVVGYGVYRNGLLQTSTAAPTVTLSRLMCGSVYEVGVDAVDAAGNRSQPRATWVKTAACSDTQPPEKPILSLGTATATSLALNWRPGVDNVGVHHYNVFLNGVKVEQTTGLTWTYTGLACGTDYALGLEVEDAAGNKSSLTEGTLSPVRTSACSSPPPPPADSTAPSQPGSLGVTAATNTSVAIAWSASTDNVGVAGYGVYVNGANVQSKTQPGATVSGLACGTAYTLAVDAFDLAGNRSTKASVVGTTAPCADTQAPSTPANVAVTSRTATSVALSWSASSDNVGVVGYGLYQDATLTGTTAVTTGIFSNLACGSAFTLALDSYDAAGNRSGRATITASTTACPDTAPPSMPTGLSTSNVTGTSMTLGWNASTDNVGVTGYDVYRNGARMASVTGTSSSQTGLACGTSYAFAVVSYDAAGNRSSQAQLISPTAACAPPPPSGETAHLWVDTDGGTCARSASPAAYNSGAACASLGKAYDQANANSDASTVLVKGGTYASQQIDGNRASSNRIVIAEAPGETVVVAGQIRFGSTGGVYEANPAVGPDYLTVRNLETGVSGGGPNRFGVIAVVGTSNLTLEGNRFGSADFFTATGASQVSSATDVVIRNNTFGPCWQVGGGGGCSNNKVEAARNALFEGNVYFDYLSDGHYECMFLNGGSNITLRGNVFRRCAGSAGLFTEDIGRVGYQNLLIENNVFGPALSGDLQTYGQYAIAIGCKAGHVGYSTLTIRNNSFGNRASMDLGSFNQCQTATNLTFTGNIVSRQGCGSVIAWSYNVTDNAFGAGTPCGITDVNIGGTTFPFYTEDRPDPSAGSYVLDGSPTTPQGLVPIALCPATDFNGNARSGSFCDAGAFER